MRCEFGIKTPKLISDFNSTQLPGQFLSLIVTLDSLFPDHRIYMRNNSVGSEKWLLRGVTVKDRPARIFFLFCFSEFDERNYLVFLLANILTGLINVLINTRAQPPLIGHLVMMVYLGTMCSVGYGIANNETVSLHLVVN